MTNISPQTIVGIDFSGAQDAGRHCWICLAEATASQFRVQRCLPASALPHSGIPREVALPALRRWLAARGPSLIGCDFPFSLPRTASATDDYVQFCTAFSTRFPNPEAVRRACCPNGHEVRRLTDQLTKAPFAPGNLRLYRQTAFGISTILAPLVISQAARVLPFQSPEPGKPWLIEVCPAVTLRRLNITARGYKGNQVTAGRKRAAILDQLASFGVMIPVTVKTQACDDPAGDVLDAIIAGMTAWLVRDQLIPPDPIAAAEGWIYAP